MRPGFALVMVWMTLLAGHEPGVQAAKSVTSVTIGESNSADQRTELLDYFAAGNDEPVTTVTLDQTQRAMAGIIDVSEITSAYSSSALTCESAGSGLTVTTRNITVVPASLYALVLATAGIDDATLAVAAPANAPAQGMTALTGVFSLWDSSPCESGGVDAARQRLALEQLALAADIGMGLGGAEGMQTATNLVLETQQRIVAHRIGTRTKVDEALARQESAFDVTLAPAQRDELVALLTRIARQDIEWGTFAVGWASSRNADDTRVSMAGKGVSRAAEPRERETARSTRVAATATAVLTPEASPLAVRGSVTGADGGRLTVDQVGDRGSTTAYTVPAAARVTRDGALAEVGAIRPGDDVSLTVDGESGRVTQVAATSSDGGSGNREIDRLWPVVLAGLLLPVLLFGALRRNGRVVGYLRPSSNLVGSRLPRSRPRDRTSAQGIIRFRPGEPARRSARHWLFR